MSKFASGKKAYFISDRSGQRYRYRDAKREWNGFIVGPDEFEPKHPQLFPVRNISDPQALRDPRPDNQNIFSVNITFPTFDLTTVRHIPVPAMLGSVGQVVATGTATGEAISVTITGISAEGYVGSVVASNIASATAAVTGVAGTSAVGSVSVLAITVYTVTVASGTNSYGYGNKYYIAGLSGASPTLTLNEGSTYRFDQSDSSNSGHPFRFSTTANGTHAGGSEYTTGVTTNGVPGSSGAYTQITVASGAPTLYYYCTNHSGMGGTANTP
jgi:hypothetical protein